MIALRDDLRLSGDLVEPTPGDLDQAWADYAARMAGSAGIAGTGRVVNVYDFPGGGVLIGTEKGLFLAREVNGVVTVAPR